MFQVILSYLPYALVTSSTPGPNNIMSLYSVSTYGWKKGLEVMSGLLTGYTCLMIICMLFCHQLAVYLPELVKYLKYVGALYILWLAVHIAMSRPSESQNNSVSFKGGFFLSISNIKVTLYLITLLTAYIIPSGAGLYEMIVHAVVILAISIVCWLMWGAVGGLLQKFIAKYYRPFNVLMGIILLWCAVQIIK